MVKKRGGSSTLTNRRVRHQAVSGLYNARRFLRPVFERLVRKKTSANYKRKAFVRTKTRRRENDLLEISQHNDLSMHKLAPFYFAKSMKGNFGAVANVREDFQQTQTFAQGRQAVGTGEKMMNRNHLIGSTNASRNLNAQSAFSYYDLNPNRNRTGGGQYATGAPGDQDFLGIKSCKITFEFLSLSSVAQTIDLYLCTPKFDVDQDPYNSWVDYLTDEGLGVANVSGPTTTTDPNAQTGSDLANNWGNSPEKNYHWNKIWRVVRKVKFVLQPGDQRNYTINVNWNKVVKKATFIDDRKGNFLKGLSLIPMYIVRAGVVGISATGTAGQATEVAHGAPRVGMIQTMEWKFKFPVSPRENVKFIQEDLVVNQDAANVVQIDVEDDPALVKTV